MNSWYRILQIVWGGKKFCGFCRLMVTMKLFHWNSLCNRLWPYKTTIQLWMLSSELQFSSATTKLFHLKWFVAIYGINLVFVTWYYKVMCPNTNVILKLWASIYPTREPNSLWLSLKHLIYKMFEVLAVSWRNRWIGPSKMTRTIWQMFHAIYIHLIIFITRFLILPASN